MLCRIGDRGPIRWGKIIASRRIFAVRRAVDFAPHAT
jgi:hypothetical protein